MAIHHKKFYRKIKFSCKKVIVTYINMIKMACPFYTLCFSCPLPLIYYDCNNIFFIFFRIFTGKMFKSAELPYLITFFQMFYNDKPVDWLLDHLISTKVCNWDKDMVRYNFILPFFTNSRSFPLNLVVYARFLQKYNVKLTRLS